MKEKIKIALAGNPNCGKTTLFNALTGARQRVGNWPGVTVEKMEGNYTHKGVNVEVVDLPGIYSFSTNSMDESVSRDFILHEKPDLIVNIIDATNLERNLYLTSQLIEMKAPFLIALNMMDLAKSRKIEIDIEKLSELLDCDVAPICANRKKGIVELKDIIGAATEKRIPFYSSQISYDSSLEESIEILSKECAPFASANGAPARWLAIKLLEFDPYAEKATENKLKDIVERESENIHKHTGEEADIVIADGRYGFIHSVARNVIKRGDILNQTLTDAIDKIALNRIMGIPIFMAIMFAVFILTTNVAGPFIGFFDSLSSVLFVETPQHFLREAQSPEWLVTIIADCLGGGIQTVSSFIPPVFMIFLCLSILEDSGYMARAAFVMDRLLRTIGLPGKAFIPMLVGFGCNVPGIMATRTLENRRDRLVAIIMNPFMSCGARLPIYALFISIFFRNHGGIVLFCLYTGGIVLSILTGFLLRKTILQGESSNFIMELPPYHMPTINGVFYHTWNRLKGFVFRAGKVIIIAILFLNFLNSLGTDGSFGNNDSDKSVLAAIGKKITPVFAPMGISENNWPATVGLFGGIFAKEAVAGILKSLYEQQEQEKLREVTEGEKKYEISKTLKDTMGFSNESETENSEFDFRGGIAAAFKSIPEGFKGFWGSLKDPLGISETISSGKDKGFQNDLLFSDTLEFNAMKSHFGNNYSAIAYLIFILIYAPCLAAIAAIYRETDMKWMLFSVLYLTGLAWISSVAFYQTAVLFTQATLGSVIWLTVCGTLLAVFCFILKIFSSINAKILD